MAAISKLPPIPRVDNSTSSSVLRKPTRTDGENFSKVLEKELNRRPPLEFSAHAQTRLLQSQIHLTNHQMDRVEKGVGQAAQKGAKDSLILVDNMALLVNVPKNIVITAIDGARMQDNVFTQIDSAVIC
jgi:flagellar operon protein